MVLSCIEDGLFLITTIPATICIIIGIIITFKSFKDLKKLAKLQQVIKHLYYIACIASICDMVTAMLASIICPESYPNGHNILSLFIFVFYVIEGLSILAILLARSHYTFRNSMFKFSKYQQISFIILYTITLLIGICSVVVICIQENVWIDTNGRLLISICSISFGILYVGTCTYGMISFAYKMYRLTKLNSTSLRNIGNDDKPKINVNQSQSKLLDRTSRYVSLLAIAIISTCIAYIVFFISLLFVSTKQEDIGMQIGTLLAVIDGMVNILSLYLQYPFAKRYYDKYCLCCAKCWNFLFTTRTERALQQKYKHLLSAKEASHSNKTETVQNVMKEEKSTDVI